jgi:CheY-like chemotaxis protein
MPKAAKMLVIEDDDMFRKMVRAMLVSAGYEVLEADSPTPVWPYTVSSTPIWSSSTF